MLSRLVIAFVPRGKCDDFVSTALEDGVKGVLLDEKGTVFSDGRRNYAGGIKGGVTDEYDYAKITLEKGARLSINGSPPGSPVPGILQARTLEWVAIAFSLQGGNFGWFTQGEARLGQGWVSSVQAPH